MPATILEKLGDDIKTAMKAGDPVRLSTLRLIKSAVMNRKIELQREVTDTDLIETVTTMLKQRQESIDQYRAAGHADRVAAEEAEIAILMGFLPQALSSDELVILIRDAVAKVGAKGPKDMGAVMKELKDKTAGRVDGKVLAEQVKAALK